MDFKEDEFKQNPNVNVIDIAIKNNKNLNDDNTFIDKDKEFLQTDE